VWGKEPEPLRETRYLRRKKARQIYKTLVSAKNTERLGGEGTCLEEQKKASWGKGGSTPGRNKAFTSWSERERGRKTA